LISVNALPWQERNKLARPSLEWAAMTNLIDVAELARDLAKIASTTSDPETGRQLMEIVERIHRALGLPPGTG
jgi:RNA polymerase-interacting CarD/CdnL/TRCF family regulator